MLIFGFGPSAPKDRGPAVPLRCPNCHNDVEYRYAVSRSWFRLFFVPVIPYGSRHLLVCPVCSRGVQLRREQGHEAAEMVAATAARAAGTLDAGAYEARVRSFLASVSAGAGTAPAAPHPDAHPAAHAGTPAAPAPADPRAAPPPAPAGWYPDPYGQTEQRYWDGTRWTNGTIPAA